MGNYRDVKVSSSLLSADFKNLEAEVRRAEEAGADFIHFDVMDGHFVPNMTIGPLVIEALKSVTELPFDVHLMIEHPERYVADFVKAGADIVTIHAEATVALYRTIQNIKELGVKAGAAISPATPASSIQHILDNLDLILVMTVEPGFPAQKFISGMLDKIREVRFMIDDTKQDILLEVDGGINEKTAPMVRQAGATVLVAGNYLFSTKDGMKKRIAVLKEK